MKKLISENKEEVKCTHCNGRGWTDDDFDEELTMTCPICDGHGEIMLEEE